MEWRERGATNRVGGTMDESRFLQLADRTFRRIQDLLEPIDPDLADYETSGDVLQISFADGSKCVINTQRPTRQIWLAARARAWHFDWDEGTGTWIDEKGTGTELLSCLDSIVREGCGASLAL
ncbi:MAG TPA: iron donor protein CyaY [Vulgatibacter sp.]